MTAPLPLGLTLSVSNSHPGCGRNSCGDSNGPCWMCRESQIWKEGAMAGARAVIARLETMRRDQCAAMCIGAAIQKLEYELKGET